VWPEGKVFAVAFTFDFDAEEAIIADDPANADRPGVLSQGTYGAKVAVPLILDLLGEKNVPATFFIPGRVAERHPSRVEGIVSAGHEIAHHGYTHTSPTGLTRDEEDAELSKGLDVLRSFASDVSGYRSPAWDFSANTEDLLVRHGFVYSSNFMDDLRRTVVRRAVSSSFRSNGRSMMRLISGSTPPAGTRRSRPPTRCARSGKASSVATGA
jgi:peptidoglycan-N-acetylglucosamine deacetylase